MTFSYANIAANSATSSSPNSNGNSTNATSTSSPVTSQPSVDTKETVNQATAKADAIVNEASSSPEKESSTDSESPESNQSEPVKETSPAKPKEKKLAPAPVPTTNVWGTSSTSKSSTSVDEHKWPTPEQTVPNTKTSNKNQKFIKPITTKWVPINAKVIMPNARSQGNQSNNNIKKNKKNTNTNNKSNRNKKTPVSQGKAQQKRSDSNDNSTKKAGEKVEKKDEKADVEALASDVKDVTINGDSEANVDVSSQASENDISSKQQSASPKQQGNGVTGHSNGHHNNNRQYSKVNYRNVNRYSLPNNAYAPSFIPFATPQPYHHPSLPNNYYPYPQAFVHPGQAQGYQPYPPQPFAAVPPASIPPPISPKQDPVSAFTQQINYYFSLENLLKDIYLRKKFDKQTGFIGFSEILNFKRVQIILNQIKSMNTDNDINETIIKALQNCSNIEHENKNSENEYDLNKVEIRVKENYKQWILD